jgi:hypothetical protein
MVDGTKRRQQQLEEEEKAFKLVIEDERAKQKPIVLLINKNVNYKGKLKILGL